MGDVAQILAPTAATVPSVGSSNFEPSKHSSTNSTKALEIAGMSKGAMCLLKGKQDLNSASLPPVVPTFTRLATAKGTLKERNSPDDKNESAPISTKKREKEKQEIKVKVGSKWISSSKRARPWAWAPFASSSRTDGAMFRHWVRKNVEYTDYPYAKFDIHMDPVTYTSEEYAAHLRSETWTRSETDRLMELARIFECRWPVIFDRFCLENSSDSSNYNHTADKKSIGVTSNTDSSAIQGTGVVAMRKIEDLQHRYYGVAATLTQIRIAQEAASEARALSAAAAKSASAAITPATNAVPAPTAVPSTISSTNATTSTSTTSTSTDRISSVVAHQERTDNLLLESAAARSLATSAKHHQPLISHVGTGTSNKVFDYLKEQERRQHLDRLWRRSKEEEEEELELRKELKTIDAQLRKLKKNGGHILAAGKTKTSGKAKSVGSVIVSRAVSAQSSGLSNQGSNAPSSRGPSRSATPVASGASSSVNSTNVVQSDVNKSNNDSNIMENSDVLDEYFASTAPVPMSQYPYLQSGRLLPPATGGSSGINKSLLARMNMVLSELSIPDRPIPTKRVCDLYDIVRKDILVLLTLKKILMQKEGQLQSKRLRLSRMGGSLLAPEDKILDEERLLGIAPPPKTPSTVTTGGSSSGASKGKTVKRKVTGGTGGKSKVAPKKSAVDNKNVTSTTIKKKTVKRKRKNDTGKTPNPFPTNVSSKSLAHGSVVSKATKVRPVSSTTVAINASPKSTTSHRFGTVASNSSLPKSANDGTAVPHALPKKTPTETVKPKIKPSTPSIISAPATTEKANNESAVKRPRKS